MLAWPLSPTTADDLHEDEERRIEGKIRHRFVAVDDEGQVVGYGYGVHYPSGLAGDSHVTVVVDPDRRNRGLGAALYDEVLRFVRDHGAALLYTEVREESPEGLRFAKKREFEVRSHSIESSLDVSRFDESSFAGLVEAVEEAGIRFFTFADAGDTPETRRKLYEINRISSIDDPASPDNTFPSFETWQRIILGASDFQPDGQIIAADGDEYVGLAAVRYDAESNSAENMPMGVARDYRGRKIAHALKLLTVRFAQERGATHIHTENDELNAPMLAINRKFGYVPTSGYYVLAKVIDSGVW